MDMQTLVTAIAIGKKIPDTAAQRAEAAATRAEEAADTVESATVQDTQSFLGIA